MSTIALASGTSITLRAPSEAEVLSYLDKRAIVEAGQRPSADHTDDGDQELCACVTSPAPAELAELLEEFPLLNRRLRDAFLELAGGGASELRRDDSVITDGHRKAGRHLVGVVYSGGSFVLKKISRFEMKALEDAARQAGRRGPLPSDLAQLARTHVVSLDNDGAAAVRAQLAAVPLLAPNLGLILFAAAQAALAVDLGK